jgi:hypothetical protein
MRFSTYFASILLISLPLQAQEKKLNPRDIDKQLFDLLKDVHNQGADLFNTGDAVGSYRLFQGSLKTARAVLTYRPADQKFIDDVLADAEKRGTVQQRAFALHESIEKLRARLRTPVTDGAEKKEPEKLTAPPRELKQETKAPVDKQPADKQSEPKDLPPSPEKKQPPKPPPLPPADGVSGRIFWQGQPVSGAEIAFVSRSVLSIRIFEGTSNTDGQFRFEKVAPGKYTVLLTAPGKRQPALPERYATTTTSPLIVDVKGGGDSLDLILQ